MAASLREIVQSCPPGSPYRKSPAQEDCILGSQYNAASGIRSRECGGGSIHASPTPCSARASALAVITSSPSVPSAISTSAYPGPTIPDVYELTLVVRPTMAVAPQPYVYVPSAQSFVGEIGMFIIVVR